MSKNDYLDTEFKSYDIKEFTQELPYRDDPAPKGIGQAGMRSRIKEKDRAAQFKEYGFETREDYIQNGLQDDSSSNELKEIKKQRLKRYIFLFVSMFILSSIIGVIVSEVWFGKFFIGFFIGAVLSCILFAIPVIVYLLTKR